MRCMAAVTVNGFASLERHHAEDGEHLMAVEGQEAADCSCQKRPEASTPAETMSFAERLRSRALTYTRPRSAASRLRQKNSPQIPDPRRP